MKNKIRPYSKRTAFLGVVVAFLLAGSLFSLALRSFGLLLLLVPVLMVIQYVQFTLWPEKKCPSLIWWTGSVGALTLALAAGTQVGIPFAKWMLLGCVLFFIPLLKDVLNK